MLTRWMLSFGFFILERKQASVNSILALTGNKTAKAFKNSTRQSEELGLNIALENLPAKYYFFMSKAEDFVKFYRETNLPVGIVMDLGHANLEGQIEPFFNMLADKIIHIHASDNDGVEDQHLGIGQGKIDWNWFAQTIKKLGYDKTVILESTTNITESLQKLKQLLG